MINFREIFNPSYSYIGLLLVIALIILIIIIEKKRSMKIIGYSCLSSGIVLLLIYLIGNLIIGSFSYKIFIQIITNNFFSSIVMLSILNICIGTISIYWYRFLEPQNTLS